MKVRRASFAVSFAGYVLLVILLAVLWETPLLLASILVPLFLLVNLLSGKTEYDYPIFLSTLVASCILEVICVSFGAWTYTRPNLINIPTYIPFAYASGVVYGLKMISALTGKDTVMHEHPRRELVKEFVVYGLLILAISACWGHDYLLTALLVLLFILAKKLLQRQPYDYYFYALAFFLAPIIDVSSIESGAWAYGTQSFFLNVPLWLPFGYALGLLLFVKVGVTVQQLIRPIRGTGGGVERGACGTRGSI